MTSRTRLPAIDASVRGARTSTRQIRTVEGESIWAELTVLAASTRGGVTHLAIIVLKQGVASEMVVLSFASGHADGRWRESLVLGSEAA